MKLVYVILVAILLAVPVHNANASIEELRESGGLLALFVAGIFILFYLFCVMLCILGGKAERKIENRNWEKTNPNTPQPHIKKTATYKVPETHSFISGKIRRKRTPSY